MVVEYRNGFPFTRLEWREFSEDEMRARAGAFYDVMERRRSVRHFSDRPVPRELIELAIKTASTAPSGAHRQPWRFVAVSEPAMKREIRLAAEEEERMSYAERMPREWLRAIEPIGTDWHKPYLEIAPWIVVLFECSQEVHDDGTTHKNYYVRESVGIAAGLFITALHYIGLATLTHTPSPMRFLTQILGRPRTERPFVLFPVGYPAEDAVVPVLERKPLHQVSLFDPRLRANEDASAKRKDEPQ